MGQLDGGSANTKKKPKIVYYNPATASVVTPASTSSSTTRSPASALNKPAASGAGSKSSKSGSSSSSSSSSSGYDYAKEQAKRDAAARNRYVTDAENLQGQVKALNKAISGSFRQALKQRLANITLVRDEQSSLIEQGYEMRSASLDADAENNLTAATDSGNLNLLNQARERASAISEAMAQGAGESDALRVQLHSLRNWDANQDGINRAFHDGQRSINAARTDLNVDTRTALANVWSESNADREQMWSNFYNQQSESQTQLGNVLGQQAEYYGLAIEAGGGGGGGKVTVKASAKAGSKSGNKSGRFEKAPQGKTAVAVGSRDRDRPLADGKADVGAPDGVLPRMVVDAEAAKPAKNTNLGAGSKASASASVKVSRGKGRGKKDKGAGPLGVLQSEAAKASDDAFMDASKTQGKVWENPGLPDRLKNWDTTPAPVQQLSNSQFTEDRAYLPLAKPEGATLRKW